MPPASGGFRIELREGRRCIYDILRRRWVSLTPEEWVRQQWIHYLVHTLQLSPARMAVERRVQVNRLRRRFDLVIFNRQAQPVLVMECKAAGRRLGAEALAQVSRYNLTLQVRFLVITSGSQTYVFERSGTDGTYLPRRQFPQKAELE